MKKTALILLTIFTLFCLCSCGMDLYKNVSDLPDDTLPAPQTKDELYSLYNAIERDMPKADIEELFGEGVPSYDDYGDLKFITYHNETKSAGVSVIFEDDFATTKTLYFNKKQNLIPFSERYTEESISLVKKDMSLEDAMKVMGTTPLELSCYFDPSGPLSTKNIYCWYNEDGSNFMVHTKNGIIENVVFYRD